MGRETGENAALNVALMDVDQEHQLALWEACVAAGRSPVFMELRDALNEQLGWWVDLLVVQCHGFHGLHVAERARLAKVCLVVALIDWWSDLEDEAHQSADFVLHTPLTPEEISNVLTSAVWLAGGPARRMTRAKLPVWWGG